MSSKSSSDVNARFEEIFARRAERRANRKSQRKADLCKRPTISVIPGSPENGRENHNATSDVSVIPKEGDTLEIPNTSTGAIS